VENQQLKEYNTQRQELPLMDSGKTKVGVISLTTSVVQEIVQTHQPMPQKKLSFPATSHGQHQHSTHGGHSSHVHHKPSTQPVA
jgi:hypothetical protein